MSDGNSIVRLWELSKPARHMERQSRAEQFELLMIQGKSGDFVSAAHAAILLHQYGEGSDISSSTTVEQLLSIALGSKDSEFLVALGEELILGELLPKLPAMALSCLKQADLFSPFKGAYALGRATFHVNPTLSKAYLKKAASHGHYASAVLHLALARRSPPLFGWLRMIYDGPAIVLGVVRNVGTASSADFFWRYKDVAPNGIRSVDRELTADRADYFAQFREKPYSYRLID